LCPGSAPSFGSAGGPPGRLRIFAHRFAGLRNLLNWLWPEKAALEAASPASGSWLIVDPLMVKTMGKTHVHVHHSAGPQSGPYAERGK